MNGNINFEMDEPYELLYTGSFVQLKNDKDITIVLSEEDGTKMKLRFHFSFDSEIKENSINYELLNEEELKVIISYKGSLINFGLLESEEIGTYNNRKIYLNFRISKNSPDDSALIHYSYYLGEEQS